MAITVEFGKCTQCNDNNPKQLQMCRKCSAPLPWAKAPKPKVTKAAAPSPVRVATSGAGDLDWGFWGVGLISFMMPIIGFFLYRSYSNNGDNKADAAIAGAALGVLVVIGRLIFRAVSAGS